MNLVLKGFRPAGSLKVRAHQLSHLIKKVQLAAVQEDNEMDEWGGCVSQMTRVVDTGNLCIYFQILFLFPLSSVVKWWSCCISKQRSQAQVSKSSSVYKPFSFYFSNALTFRHLDNRMETLRDQGLQGVHQRLFYLLLWCNRWQTGFLHQINLADVSLLFGEGETERKQNWDQTQFSEKVLGIRYSDSVVRGLCVEATLPECLVLSLVHWAWNQQALAGRQGKRWGKHCKRRLWAHLSQRPGKTDLKSGKSLLGLLAPESSLSLQNFLGRKLIQRSVNQRNSWWPISIPIKEIVLERSFCFFFPLTFFGLSCCHLHLDWDVPPTSFSLHFYKIVSPAFLFLLTSWGWKYTH